MSSHSLSTFQSSLSSLKLCKQATSSTKPSIISHLSSITGSLIWGEKHDSQILKYSPISEFQTSNILNVYHDLIVQDFDREITIQLLQSSSMMIHNITNVPFKSYLLHSEYFKQVFSHAYDFADSEIIENFMSLLKGFAVNLTSQELRDYLFDSNFSLFTGAMIFFNNPEPLVKTSARNVVLKVLKVNDPGINKIILDSGFLLNLVSYLKESFMSIIRTIESSKSLGKLESVISDSLDLLYEFNDIFELDIKVVGERLQDAFMKMLVLPVLASSIIDGEPKPHHVPVPVAIYAFTLITKIIDNPPVRAEILEVLLSNLVPASYMEVMTSPPNRNSPKLEKSSERISNPVQSLISRFLKCKEDNLLGLSLSLVQSIFYKSISEYFNRPGQSKPEILSHLLSSFSNIFTSEAENRFFTVFLAGKLLLDLYSSNLFPDHTSEFKSLVRSALSLKSKTVLHYIESCQTPIDFIQLFKTEEEFVSNQSWEDYLNLPLNYSVPSIGDASELPLEVRRGRTETEYVQSDVRLFLMFKRLKGLLKPLGTQEKFCVLPFDSIVESSLIVGEFYDVDSDEVKGKTTRKVIEKGITGHVRFVIDDKWNLILASLHTDMDCYLIETCVRFSKLSVVDRPEPNVIILLTGFGETLMLVFEDNTEWIMTKNIIEKRIKECVEYDLGLLRNFILEDN